MVAFEPVLPEERRDDVCDSDFFQVPRRLQNEVSPPGWRRQYSWNVSGEVTRRGHPEKTHVQVGALLLTAGGLDTS